MRRWEKYLVVTALTAGLSGGSFVWGQQQMPKPTVPPVPTPAAPAAMVTPAAVPAVVGAKVNLNTADEAGLMAIKGIGKSKAKAIIEYRQKNGPFKSVDELTKIKGIKEKSLQKLRDQLTV
jgi:competence protein ComEA